MFSEVLVGIRDSITLWNAFSSSRSLKMFAIKPLPFFAISLLLIGPYFYFTSAPKMIYLIGWELPAYIVGSLLHIRFIWLVTKLANMDVQIRSDGKFSHAIAEVVYGILLSLTYLLQTYLLQYLANALLPHFLAIAVVPTINLFMISWATAFTAFESKLITKNNDLGQRITFIEQRWSYALGYGLIASIMYNFLPSMFGLQMWQYMQLLLTLRAHKIDTNNVPLSSSRLRIFRIAKEMATFQINLFVA